MRLSTKVILGTLPRMALSGLLRFSIIFFEPFKFSLLLADTITISSASNEIVIPDISDMPVLESINRKSGASSFFIFCFRSRKNEMLLGFWYTRLYQSMEDNFLQ